MIQVSPKGMARLRGRFGRRALLRVLPGGMTVPCGSGFDASAPSLGALTLRRLGELRECCERPDLVAPVVGLLEGILPRLPWSCPSDQPAQLALDSTAWPSSRSSSPRWAAGADGDWQALALVGR